MKHSIINYSDKIRESLRKGEGFELKTNMTPSLTLLFKDLEQFDIYAIDRKFETNGNEADWFQEIEYKGTRWTLCGSLWGGGLSLFKNN